MLNHILAHMPQGRLARFPLTPATCGKTEEEAFAPLAETFQDIIKIAFGVLNKLSTCTVVYSPNTSPWDPTIKSEFKSDDNLVLVQTTACPGNKHTRPLCDLLDFEEFKLKNSEKDANDNPKPIVHYVASIAFAAQEQAGFDPSIRRISGNADDIQSSYEIDGKEHKILHDYYHFRPIFAGAEGRLRRDRATKIMDYIAKKYDYGADDLLDHMLGPSETSPYSEGNVVSHNYLHDAESLWWMAIWPSASKVRKSWADSAPKSDLRTKVFKSSTFLNEPAHNIVDPSFHHITEHLIIMKITLLQTYDALEKTEDFPRNMLRAPLTPLYRLLGLVLDRISTTFAPSSESEYVDWEAVLDAIEGGYESDNEVGGGAK
ncbi:hypothetical protein B0H10DRAFT_2432098 [Mycena sp. CBHHK59/15]|nr:hypothetical protein B0H10DRAFT_2432098 [Mycena sp. CBHHK59/15]